MDMGVFLEALIPSWSSVTVLVLYFDYLAVAGSVLPGKVVPGVILQDGSHLRYRCNGLLSLLLLVVLLGIGAKIDVISPTVISERGVELLSATFTFSFLVTLVLYAAGCNSKHQGCSLKPHITRNLIHDWWFGMQLNPQFLGIDPKFFFVRAGMMGWLFINLSILAKWLWLLANKVELTTAAVIANCLVFLLGYVVFRGANKQKHGFKKNPKATIWGRPPKVIGGKLLASGYWGIARHCNYLGDFLLALSFSLPCGLSSPVPYFYPIYLLILLIWRERRDEARCAEKYKEVWAEYRRLVPRRILPYLH